MIVIRNSMYLCNITTDKAEHVLLCSNYFSHLILGNILGGRTSSLKYKKGWIGCICFISIGLFIGYEIKMKGKHNSVLSEKRG